VTAPPVIGAVPRRAAPGQHLATAPGRAGQTEVEVNMPFVHPGLRPFLAASQGQPALAGAPVAEVRAANEARARNRPPGPPVAIVRDLHVTGDDGHEIPVRLYIPEGARGVTVAFHGGGWIVGNLDTYDDTARNIASESGQAVVSVDYRLSPENRFPSQIDDAWAVTRWVAERGAQVGLPNDRLMLLGDSAGGNLAAVTALRARDAGGPDIRLQMLVYPATDARTGGADRGPFGEGYFLTARDIDYTLESYGVGSLVEAGDWRVSPLLAASHRGVAPALIISAECDPLHADAAAYARKLLEDGVSAVHVTYSGVTHLFFGMRGALDAAEYAQRQAADALRVAALA